jgi:hypothetical protein
MEDRSRGDSNMSSFVVNAQPQGGELRYVIHNLSYGCDHMRQHVSWVKLGDFLSCEEALLVAANTFPDVVACKYCCVTFIATGEHPHKSNE